MRYLRGSLVIAMLAGLMAPASPAHAQQADASRAPRSSGPLIGAGFDCEDNESPKAGGMNAQACGWMYQLAPAETNLAEDISAYWVQIEIDPGRECAKLIEFDLSLPDDMRVISAAAEKSRRVPKPGSKLVELTVDAEGAAPLPGHLEQDVAVAPGREKVALRAHSYSYRWIGNSRDKVVVAVGVEFTHAALPPDFFYTWSEGIGIGWGSCRPHLIRAA